MNGFLCPKHNNNIPFRGFNWLLIRSEGNIGLMLHPRETKRANWTHIQSFSFQTPLEQRHKQQVPRSCSRDDVLSDSSFNTLCLTILLQPLWLYVKTGSHCVSHSWSCHLGHGQSHLQPRLSKLIAPFKQVGSSFISFSLTLFYQTPR